MFMIIALCLFVSSSIFVYMVTGLPFDRIAILFIGYVLGGLFSYGLARHWFSEKAWMQIINKFNKWESSYRQRSGL